MGTRILYCFVLFFLLSGMIGCQKQETTKEPMAEEAQKAQDSNNAEEITEKKIKKPVEKTAEEKKEEWIQQKLSSMTLEQKIGQMFMLCYRQTVEGTQPLAIEDGFLELLTAYEPGGIILFAENIDTKAQTKALISDLQEKSKIPLLIGIDEEGGRVSRLTKSGNMDIVNIPSAAELARGGNPEDVYLAYKEIGQELKELGFTVDFAPIADVNTNPKNTVIGDRAFGNDPQAAAKFVVKAVEGLQDSGIAACLKHFPGHGDTLTDSHTEETYVTHTMERLQEMELVPFLAGIQAKAAFVMVGHIKTPEATGDGLPASMSWEMITGVLREEIGFDGIIITDAMDMGAIASYYDSGEAAVRTILAGADILLMPEDPKAAFKAVLSGVQQGDIEEKQIEEAVKRVLSLKYDEKLF